MHRSARAVHHLSAWLFVGFLVAKNLSKVGGLFNRQINCMRRSVAEGVRIMGIMITPTDKGLLKEQHVHEQPPGIEQQCGICLCFPAPHPWSLNSSRLIWAHHKRGRRDHLPPCGVLPLKWRLWISSERPTASSMCQRSYLFDRCWISFLLVGDGYRASG